MSDKGVWLENAFYSFGELKNNRYGLPHLSFCHDWLSAREIIPLQTSGSTGTPKKINMPRERMESSARGTAAMLHPRRTDKLFLCLNISGIGGLMMLVRAMEWNLDIRVADAQANPMKILPNQHDLTIVSLVPLQLKTILEDKESKQKLSCFRQVILGGAALDTDLQLQEFSSTTFYHSYGMTETCSHIAFKRLNGEESQRHFYPLPGIELKVNERDCLGIRGEVTGNEWLETNDLVSIHTDGGFDILGRADMMINSGGVKINPVVIEETINGILPPELSKLRFFVTGVPDKVFGEKVVLVIEREENPELRDHLLSELSSRLKRYEVPKECFFVPGFIETASGKVDRRATVRFFVERKKL